jgi:protein-disulfide isomerase
MTRGRLLLLAGAAAVLIAAVLIGVSVVAGGGDDGGGGDDTSSLRGVTESSALLRGIPQEGIALGRSDAPVTLAEYADFQCPFCREWALRTLPALVRDYVRKGDLRIEFRGLAFIGPDSLTALEAAQAAGEQDKLWNVADLLYWNQGGENTGWVTDELLTDIAAAVPGLDGDQMLADRDSAAVASRITEASAEATRGGISTTPSFQIGKTGGTLSNLAFTSLEPDEFTAAVDQQLGR